MWGLVSHDKDEKFELHSEKMGNAFDFMQGNFMI